MSDYVISYDYDDPDPAGRPTSSVSLAHAFDLNLDQVVCGGARGLVRPEEPWVGTLARVPRCPECVAAAGGRLGRSD